MERETLLKMWDESWTEVMWFGSWSGAMDGVSAAQATWRPQLGAHSIWQLVNHVCFWREVTMRRLSAEPGFSEEENNRHNFAETDGTTEEHWAAAKRRLEDSHQK